MWRDSPACAASWRCWGCVNWGSGWAERPWARRMIAPLRPSRTPIVPTPTNIPAFMPPRSRSRRRETPRGRRRGPRSWVLCAVLAGYGLEGDDALHATRGLRGLLHGFVSLETGGGFGVPLDLDESFRRLLQVFMAGLRVRS